MPIDSQGYWYPDLSPKQLEIYNCRKRYILSSGPRRSGKTLGNLHRVVRHGVETEKARVGMFAKTIKNATSGGIWQDILDIVLPEWFNADIGVQFTTRRSDGTLGPKQNAQSRMLFFRISNQFGGESEFQLHSIDNENEIESIAKGTRFSCFYFAELSNFRERAVFDTTTEQLRMPHLAFEDHLWIADTNPPDSGDEHWTHDIWFKLPDKKDKEKHEQFLVSQLALIHVMIEDNPYLTENEIADLYAKYAYDPDLFARYIKGQWVRAQRGGIFAQHFRHDVHVVGNTSSINDSEWQILLPSEHCTELVSGWDLGDKYHSVHILEPINLEGQDGKAYQILDEITHLDKHNPIGMSEFTESVTARMEYWEKVIGGKKPFWRHWSDSSAITNYRSGAETYDKNLVYKYSDGKITLEAAPKFRGSILKRIQLLKILLFENRLIMSSQLLFTINMFKSLRQGTGAKVVADTIYRHVFDSLAYALAAEEPGLLFQELMEMDDDKPHIIYLS
jgi:hypothetical protein